MRIRYEAFGGIIALDDPAATLYVDQQYMRELGYQPSPLWRSERSYLSAPLTAHFAVTHRCPMECQTCYSESLSASFDGLPTHEAKAVLRTLAKMKVFTVAFGGGEPLARPDIFELASHARRLGLSPTLTTNGFYVDRPMAARCRVFDHVHVSLDGVGHVYRAVRGVDGFDKTARAIRLLVQNGISVGVNTVLCRTNFEHVEEIVQFVTECGIRDIIFLRLKPGGRAKPQYDDLRLTPHQGRAVYPMLKELAHHYNLHIHVDCAMMPFVYYHHPDNEALRLFAAEGCVGANEIIEILPSGNVQACSFAHEVAGKAQDLPRLWHSAPSFERFRHWIEEPSKPCLSCTYLELCRGGCRAAAAAVTGDPNAPDPECPFVSERRK